MICFTIRFCIKKYTPLYIYSYNFNNCKRIIYIILTNTSVLNREKLINKNRQELGGLSGFPIFKISNDKIKIFYKFIGKKIPIIGVGGVFDGETAYEKIKCGASLLQLYTSLVYQGPLIASSINEELSNLLDRDGFKNLSEVVGINNN